MIRIPLSTYRLQFNRDFTFAQATEIVPYLAALGISHCYASPYLRARPGSTHGYDIIDHHHLNAEIGTPEEYDRFVSALHEHGMGQILDIVPNHMGVMGADNAWWLDVLENGEASAYADFFDIDWEPLKDELQGKVLVPVLADQYGVVLDRGELKLSFDADKGEFSIFYFQHRFPVNPREYSRILVPVASQLQAQLGDSNEDLLELQSLISAFGHLPGRSNSEPEKRAERNRDKEINKKRLAALCARSRQVASAIEATSSKMNGIPGEPESFDALHDLIKNQAFRLAYWRVAADDINYRRFFDVNDLAAVRQENEAVFTQTHEFVLQLLREERVDGLRIDHPDGLYNPLQYFLRLQSGSAGGGAGQKRVYVVVEKILSGNEQVPEGWPIDGTTGYAFANLVNGLFIDTQAEGHLTDTYHSFIGKELDFKALVYECKKLVMDRSLNSELNVLANHLSRIALADRHTCDFTVKSLREALTEIVACFPVYRTYVTERQVSPADFKYITQAVECAKTKSTAADSSVYDFIREVLVTQQAEGHPQFYQNSVVHFAMRFQQYSSAVMAKGFEDTSLYRYHRLTSLNDVGGDPLRFGVSVEEFHSEMEHRARSWPHAMLTTSTHDSKRSEDVRARINVLSEVPDVWRKHVSRWQELNSKFKREGTPSANDEYLLYQTLVGTWPAAGTSDKVGESYIDRISEYMLKAIREAKENTSWSNTNESYESGVKQFVEAVLGDKASVAEIGSFSLKVLRSGMLNSLAQTLIKLTAPGVPDIYQGNDLWRFDLVDPDNRQPVDYAARQNTLQNVRTSQELAGDQLKAYLRELLDNPEDGRVKLYTIWKALGLRRSQPELFTKADYTALHADGQLRAHIVAYTRAFGDSRAIVVVPRLCARLLGEAGALWRGEIWQNTFLRLPFGAGKFRNLFTGELLETEQFDRGSTLAVASVLNEFPVALLVSRH
jgi:(1->4)-alpha-D-glucan 1-alpha-D-glucosylmutase